MLSKKSISSKFFIQLASTIALLVVIFSILFYQVLKISIMQNEFDIMTQNAINIKKFDKKSSFTIFKDYDIVNMDKKNDKSNFKIINENNKKILVLTYPYNDFGDYLILKRDITQTIKILDTIFIGLLLTIAIAISLVIFYSLFLSRILSIHLKELSLKISRFDDDFKNRLNLDDYPLEFKEIINSVNHLINRIQNYNSSQKELFIGIAHELKTPLAVIKAKNDVTLIKQREIDYYIETIKNSNNSIDNMNKIINEILKIGRLEGAQFEDATEIDLIEYIQQESKNFSLLGSKSGQKIELDLKPESMKIKIQKTLFSQILQNFIQNALKFSPANSTIKISSEIIDNYFYLYVDDEGEGVSEDKDYFAPFKRYGNKEGVGLGLYLSKSAATALKAKISLANKKTGNGARATFKIRVKNL